MKKNLFKMRSIFVLCTLFCIGSRPFQAQSQIIYKVAGTGSLGSSGDGAAATSAKMSKPTGIAFDATGNLYVADSGLHTIRKVDVTTGFITTIAGTAGTASSTGDGGNATSATLNSPLGLTFDASGNLYVSEALGHRIRKINTAGKISTIAGTGTAGSTGDGSAATSATLNEPAGIVFDASGNLYIAESEGDVIRMVNTSGVISTVVGTGVAGSTGDGGAATLAKINAPVGLAINSSGELIISESASRKIRKVSTSGTISTIAGTGANTSLGDGGDATLASFRTPTGIVFDAEGNLYISEAAGRFIRMINTSGVTSTVAGTGTVGSTGDGGNATDATFRNPFGLAVQAGNIFIADFSSRCVRMICNPIAPAVTAAVSICEDATASALTANGTNLKWYSTATSSDASATAPVPVTTTPGTFTYYVSQTSFQADCESPRAVITVTVNPKPATPVVTDTVAFCQTVTATALTATGTDIKWYTAATGGTGSTTAPTPTTTTAGFTNFYATQTSAVVDGGCESDRAEIAVKVNAQPAAPTVVAVRVCVGAPTTALTATGTNLLWYDNATGGTGTATAPTPSSATAGVTNYYVTQTSDVADGGCESERAKLVFRANDYPAAPTVTDTIQLCEGVTAAALTATGSNLKWYDAAASGSPSTTAPVPSTAATGAISYFVSQSLSASSGGCESDRSEIVVITNSIPVAPTVTATMNYCQSVTATALTATGDDIKWYTVATGGTGSATAPTPSTGTAGVTSFYATQSTDASGGHCESERAEIAVTIIAKPGTPTVSAITICLGATTTALTAAGSNLQWYDAATGGTASTTAPTPSSATAGTTTYYVTQTSDPADGSCESSRAGLAFTVNNYPAAPTVTSSIQLCEGVPATAVLTASGSNLQWYDAPTGGTASTTAPTPSTATAGTISYFVSQSLSAAAGGCEGNRSEIAVTTNAIPAPPTVTTPLNLCFKGGTAPLTAVGNNLKWYTVATGGSASISAPIPSTAAVTGTDYYVSQTSSAATGSCESGRSNLNVQIQPTPVVSVASLASSGIIFCEGKTITLAATAPTAVSYQWSTLGTPVPGATFATFDAGTTGLSGVEITDIYGCKNSAEMHVQQDTTVKPTLSPTEAMICIGGSTMLICNPGYSTYTFRWIKDGVDMFPATPKTNNKSVTAAGTYTVSVTNNFGCINTTTAAKVGVYPVLPKQFITNNDPWLEMAKGFTYYQWYRNGTVIAGANIYKYFTATSGSYFAEITDKNGCISYSDTVKIEKAPTSIMGNASGTDLNIYPNPAKNVVFIESATPVNVTVSDMIGKVVFEGRNVQKVDLGNMSAGTYLFRISDENNQLISIEKVVKLAD
jgi:uncharacterized protein YjiK